MHNRKGYVCFNNSCVNVELPATSEEMEMGLMNRANLPESDGMLFIFDEECVHKIWMKNMFISLDVIWLDSKGTIIHIDKNIMPCNGYCQPFGPELYSKFVIEVNGSYTDKYSINIGDNVRMIY